MNVGSVHKGTNHVLKDVSDRDPLRDWDRDLNYVRSHALQTLSQSRTGSAHCDVMGLFTRERITLQNVIRPFPDLKA